jgi:hypothetical protein
MITAVVLLSLLGCISMMVQDSSGTILVIAESRGNSRLAGAMDVIGDAAKFVMYAYSGALLMTQYGWLGRAFILPILATGYVTTSQTTKWASKRIKDHDDEDVAAKLLDLQRQIDDLTRGSFART